ncbi:MAG: UDP-2,3-diacylglucosamine diphosphatase [Gammaproteobacteria bacterium]
MPTLFISDLHLDQNNPHLTELFRVFLSEHARAIDALYIIGDLFQVWLGDDIADEYQRLMIKLIQDYTRSGIPTYFMPGNRDFLIGQQFSHQTGCHLLTDPSLIDLYGQLTFVTHGDRLCTRDRAHQVFRLLSQNTLAKKIFLSLPAKYRQFLAGNIRKRSIKRKKDLAMEIMDITPEIIPIILDKFHVLNMIHGHTHRPAMEFFNHHEQEASRIVLSDWREKGNYLLCQANGVKELVYFDLSGNSDTPL